MSEASAIMKKSKTNENEKADNVINIVDSTVSWIPEISQDYVRWGHFDTVRQIIESNRFYPTWITGLSGNGKTQMIEQACACAGLPQEFFDPIPEDKPANERRDMFFAKQQMITDLKGQYGREFIRVNFTVETDESQLIGGFRLVDGDTVFQEGPVVEALRRGAILLFDEVDVGHTNKIMCLQSVLEGKGVLIKDTNEYVKPSPGFNIFATSNTKGHGSEDGRFIGTNMMNGAFLDRFAGMLYQEYPSKEVEEEILRNYFYSYHCVDGKEFSDDEIIETKLFVRKLCDWSELIRLNYAQGSALEVITTRTLINIIQGYAIMNDRMKAIDLACERYDGTIKEEFMTYYSKVDETVYAESSTVETRQDGVKVEETDTHFNISAVA